MKVKEFCGSAPSTNVELLVSLMEISKHGALGQMFIVDAVRKAAEAVVKADHVKMRAAMKDGMVSADAWISTAKEIHAACEKFYGERGPGSYMVKVERAIPGDEESYREESIYVGKATGPTDAMDQAEQKKNRGFNGAWEATEATLIIRP